MIVYAFLRLTLLQLFVQYIEGDKHQAFGEAQTRKMGRLY